jgi:tetratricopeptide (TPR) repeat protein
MIPAIVIFCFSLLALVSLFLVKLSQISQRPQVRVKIMSSAAGHHESLWPYFREKLRVIGNSIWYFILEAKDLKPAATTKTIHTQVDRVVKNVFRIRIRSSENEPQWLPEAAELTIKPTINQNPEDIYLEAIKRDPQDKQAYESLGRLYLQNKNYRDAIEIYEYLIKLDPARDIYFSNLGLAYYSVGEFQKASMSYEKAIGINNKIPTRWINLALCLDALDQPTKVVKAITQALQFDKMNVNFMMLLADAYAKLTNNVRAEEVLEQILSLEPTNKVAREKLMRLKI